MLCNVVIRGWSQILLLLLVLVIVKIGIAFVKKSLALVEH